MLKHYELTDQEWEQVASLLPPEKTGKPGRPSKDNRTMLNAMVWIARSGKTTVKFNMVYFISKMTWL